ncbi:Hcp family type VI secretion system effector [Erwinia aphidicola]|uniref:Hcp family type VI secretion system effector n=1 Tax=Erwinia aphidicola TaxID=68334 RepID=UPI003CEDC40C
MSNPAYLWLEDENGSPIVGGSLVNGRLGAIELKSLSHNLNIPVDGNTGRLTGTRVHAPIMVQKEFDKTTPLLYRALVNGAKLKRGIIKLYEISEAGREIEYFNILLDNVKIVSITPDLCPGAAAGTQLETIMLRYEMMTWKHCNGNMVFKDSWNERMTA